VLIRRTHLAFESADQARAVARAAGRLMALPLGWSAGNLDTALRAYEAELERTFRIAEGPQ